MWKRLFSDLARFLQRPRRGRSARRTIEDRSRFWSDVREGQLEAEAASVERPLAPAAKR